MKKMVILNHDGGELANQLWNYASIYAYALECGTELSNPSFYEYASWFPRHQSNKLFWFFFVRPFSAHFGRKNSLKRRVWRKTYALYPWLIVRLKKHATITCAPMEPYSLPPTGKTAELSEKESRPTIYFNGWLFRNPEGLKKYRSEIIKFFAPNDSIMQKIDNELTDARKQYRHIVGVHIRQGDYRTWQNGKYFVGEERVRAIIDEYLAFTSYSVSETLFIITSDGPVNTSIFLGLNIKLAQGNAIEDMFLLSKTDIVVGSDSTYGDFAAYYGDIPHIIMTNSIMDWEYYRGKNKYFMGEYATWVHF